MLHYRDYSHAPQLQSAGGAAGFLTDSAARADVKIDTVTKATANQVINESVVFIVLYFMQYLLPSFALLAISLLLVVDRGYDPLSRGYQPRVLAIELIH